VILEQFTWATASVRQLVTTREISPNLKKAKEITADVGMVSFFFCFAFFVFVFCFRVGIKRRTACGVTC